MYEVVSYLQKWKWEEKLKLLKTEDIFCNHAYSSLYLNQEEGGGEPHLFFYENEKGNRLGYIFLKRRIGLLPFISDKDISHLYDITTPPYTYGGPIYDMDDEELIKGFRLEFEDYCQKENIVSEFIRFHPLRRNNKYLDSLVDVSLDRESVLIDLTLSEEEIYKRYHTNHKRNVKKALRNQLKFRVYEDEEALEIIDMFYELYKETMDRLHASSSSYFSTKYLKDLLSGLRNKSMIGVVLYGDKMIAAAVCMYEGGILHYHLGCSKKDFLNLGANVFLFHSITLWGKRKGLDFFHLGGGHGTHVGNGGRDSLFQFKYRFNPEGVINFYVGKKIHNQLCYNLLIQEWENFYSQKAPCDYVPAYRRIPV